MVKVGYFLLSAKEFDLVFHKHLFSDSVWQQKTAGMWNRQPGCTEKSLRKD